MHLSSINSAPEEPVSHNPAAKKQVWFRKGDLPPFTQIARVVIPPGGVLAAHAVPSRRMKSSCMSACARMLVDGHPHDLKPGDAIALASGETHELFNRSHGPIIFVVAGWVQK